MVEYKTCLKNAINAKMFLSAYFSDDFTEWGMLEGTSGSCGPNSLLQQGHFRAHFTGLCPDSSPLQ